MRHISRRGYVLTVTGEGITRSWTPAPPRRGTSVQDPWPSAGVSREDPAELVRRLRDVRALEERAVARVAVPRDLPEPQLAQVVLLGEADQAAGRRLVEDVPVVVLAEHRRHSGHPPGGRVGQAVDGPQLVVRRLRRLERERAVVARPA